MCTYCIYILLCRFCQVNSWISLLQVFSTTVPCLSRLKPFQPYCKLGVLYFSLPHHNEVPPRMTHISNIQHPVQSGFYGRHPQSFFRDLSIVNILENGYVDYRKESNLQCARQYFIYSLELFMNYHLQRLLSWLFCLAHITVHGITNASHPSPMPDG